MEDNHQIFEDQELLSNEEKGTCFLCLKEEVLSKTNDHNDKNKSEVCLSKVLTYLDIRPNIIIEESLKHRHDLQNQNKEDGLSNWENLNKLNISVNLCPKCVIITNKVSGLFNGIEKMKIMIAKRLNELQNIIQDSYKEQNAGEQSRSETLKEVMMTCFKPEEVNLVETLRYQLKEKCFTKIKEFLGTNRSNQSSQREIPNEIAQSRSLPDDNSATSGDTSTQMTDEPQASTSFDTTESLKTTEATISRISTQDKKQTVWNVCKNYFVKLKSGKKYKCLICQNSFPLLRTQMGMHILNAHPGKYFASKLPQDLSESTFKVYCKRILTETSRTKSVSFSTGNFIYFCVCCNRKYSALASLKYHLVSDHFKFIDKKLIESLRIPIKTNSNWICIESGGGCDKSFSSKSNLKIHQNKSNCGLKRHQVSSVSGQMSSFVQKLKDKQKVAEPSTSKGLKKIDRPTCGKYNLRRKTVDEVPAEANKANDNLDLG